MSATASYRALLRSLRLTCTSEPDRQYFGQYIRRQFDIREAVTDEKQVQQLTRLAHQCAAHFRGTADHTAVLKRYNITVNRDGSQKEHVKAVAGRVGLTVPH